MLGLLEGASEGEGVGTRVGGAVGVSEGEDVGHTTERDVVMVGPTIFGSTFWLHGVTLRT